MVSVDHFGYELRRQLNEAAANGANELLLTCHELCRSVRSGTAWLKRAAKRWSRRFVRAIPLFRTGAGTEWPSGIVTALAHLPITFGNAHKVPEGAI
jgi:hypothetical protein